MVNHTATKQCGLTEFVIFVAAIISGTACSLCSKTMMELHGEGKTGQDEIFQKPIFQTFGMFVGMLFGLVMHWVVVWYKIPFPGYPTSTSADSTYTTTETDIKKIAFDSEKSMNTYGSITTEQSEDLLKKNNNETTDVNNESTKLPIWMYFFLAIPSVFDLGATVLCMMGLQYIDVSVYQLLRGSGIIFVALMKQHVLNDKLLSYQWLGVIYNVVSVFLVGATAILNETETAADETITTTTTTGKALWGVLFVMAGAIVQAMQFVFEEKVMTMDIPSPPLLLIGMEGLWGTILCLVIVYPLAYILPGNDHGSYEDPINTLTMFANSSTIQYAFMIYFFVIFMYNLLAVLVTFMLDSVWHAILDNFRPITVWVTDLFIFYVIASGVFGEPWTKYSWIQLFGMIVLLYGTAIYNAPNAGSIKLQGQWYALGFDFRKEYDAIEEQREEQILDVEWEERMQSYKVRKGSSFYGEHSPHISIHTQALRGLAATHN